MVVTMGSPGDSQDTSGGNPAAIAAGVTVGLLMVVAAVIAVGIAMLLVTRKKKRNRIMSILNVQGSDRAVSFTKDGMFGQQC